MAGNNAVSVKSGAAVNRSRVRITGTISANTAISVNVAQANTSHGGYSSHDLGADDVALQASIEAGTTRITVNGIPQDVEWVSASTVRWAMELRSPTVILVEVDA